MSEHRVHTTIPIGPDDEGAEVEVAIRFSYVPGAPATGPTYASGGEPGYGSEIEFISAERYVNGEPRPYEGSFADLEAKTLQDAAAEWLEENYDAAAHQAAEDSQPDPDDARDRAIEDRLTARHDLGEDW